MEVMKNIKPKGLKKRKNKTAGAYVEPAASFGDADNKFKVLFEMSPYATFLETLQGQIIDCNDAAVRMSGYLKSELLTMEAADLVPKKVRKLFPGIIQQELTKRTFHLQAENQRKNGEIFPVDVLGRVVDINKRKYVLVKVEDMTEKRQQIKRLEESEEMFRLLFDDIPDGVLVVDLKTERFFLANPTMEKMLGRKQKDMVKMRIKDLHPESARTFVYQQFKSIARGKTHTAENIPVLKKDKTVFYADIRAFPFTFKGSMYFVGIFTDITEKRKVADALELESKKNMILNQIVKIANESNTLSQLLSDSLLPILKTLDFDGGGIYLVNKEKSRAEVVAAYNLHQQFLKTVKQVNITKKPYSTIFIKGEPIITEYFDKLFSNAKKESRLKTLVSIPLIAGDEIIGALNIASERRTNIPQSIKEILVSIGKELGSAIRRVQIEERLKKHEEQFETIVNHSLDIIYTFDNKGRVVFITPNVEQAGYKVSEILGEPFKKFVHPDDMEKVFKELRLTTKTKKVFMSTFRLLKKGGGSIYVEEYGKPVFDSSGKLTLFTGVLRDITERMKAEDERKHYTERLRIMFEDAPDAYYLSDLRGVLVDGNKAAERLLGHKKEELIGQSFLGIKNLIAEGQKKKVLNLLAKNIRGESTGPDEFQLYKSDGSVIEVEISTHPVIIGGKHLVLGIARDITEHKRIEMALQEERDFSQNILKTAQIIIVVLDMNGKIVSINPYMERISGYRLNEVKGADWFDTFLPSMDRAKIRKVFRDVSSGNLNKGNINPILTKSGKEVLVEWFSSTLADKQGNTIGVLSAGQDVTERTRVQEKLKVSEENYRNLVDNSSELILVAQDGLFKFFNPKVAEILKYSPKELANKPFIDVIHPDDKKMVATRYAKRIRGDKDLPTSYFFRVVDKTGGVIWVEITAVLITWEGRPATLNFLQDVTIRKKAEEELKLRVEELEKTKTAMLNVLEDMQKEKSLSESMAHDMEKFKLAVEGVSEHIIITDIEANIIFANHAAEVATGFKINEMLGKNPGILWGGQMDKDFYRKMWNAIKKEKKNYSAEITNKTKSGELYTAAIHIAPILNKEGKVVFFVGIERDITKAKEVDKMKTEFISVASHQLRTPLTTVKWYAELLLAAQNDINKKSADYVHKIYDSNQKMIRLVNDLLNVSRIESGKKFMIEKKSSDIISIIKRVVADQSILAGQNNIKIDVDGLPKKLILNIDNEKIYQVFQNLINNAVKYSHSGSKVVVAYEKSGDGSVLIVRDRGLGIPTSQQDRVFEKFFRADNVVESGKGGSGLGLYIARAIVEGHNGRLWFESSVKEGTTFYVQLPK